MVGHALKIASARKGSVAKQTHQQNQNLAIEIGGIEAKDAKVNYNVFRFGKKIVDSFSLL